MEKANLNLLKKLRDETAASIADCRVALEQSANDYKKALGWIKKRSVEKAEKKADRETSSGIIEAYIHQNGKVGAMVELLCETDFVARTAEFKNLAHEIAMQVAAMKPRDVKSLLRQEYIRDSSIAISDLIKQAISKFGENIVIKGFTALRLEDN